MRDVLLVEPIGPVRDGRFAASDAVDKAACDRLAAELHDSLGATLSLLVRRLDTLLAGRRGAEATVELRRLRGLTLDALGTLRGVVETLDLARYRDAKLDRALRHLAADFAHIADVCVDVRVRGPVADLPRPLGRLLLWIAREALFDVGRNARATFVMVTLSAGPADVVLEVADDGVDVAQRRTGDWRSPSPELGLAAIARAVAAAGGRFTVLRGTPRGLRLRAVVPCDTGVAS